MKYLNILFFLTLISCNSTRTDRGFILNSDLIKPFFRNDYLYPENPDYNFVQIAKYTIDLNNNNRLDTIVLRKIQDWTDTGDFHQMEITLDNKQKIIETCFDGWVKFGENYSVNDNLRKLNKINSDLLLVTDFDTDRILIFAFGWVYASTPGLMTVIDANGQTPKVIFNDNFGLEKIDNNSFTGQFEYSEKSKTIRLLENRLEIQ
jgi:hypothetical protein